MAIMDMDTLLGILIISMVALVVAVLGIVILRDLSLATAVLVLVTTIASYMFGHAQAVKVIASTTN
jgi:hypothetical protein